MELARRTSRRLRGPSRCRQRTRQAPTSPAERLLWHQNLRGLLTQRSGAAGHDERRPHERRPHERRAHERRAHERRAHERRPHERRAQVVTHESAFSHPRDREVPLDTHALRRAITGSVRLPSDVGYDEARIGASVTPVEDRFPALIVQPRTPDEVARALEFAQANTLAVSVRSGGHDVLGASTASGGMVIDLAGLTAVSVDVARGVALVGGGTRAGSLVTAAARHGFVPVVGGSNSVGLGGLTLGGGIGLTCGTHGAVVDNLVAAEVVAADGRVLRASAEQHPELFWALRGGGGNFGVVTSFTYRMPRLGAVFAGRITVRSEATALLRFLRDFLASSPDELDVVVSICPGRVPVSVWSFCWVGDEVAGKRAIAPIRAGAMVIAEDVSWQPFERFMASNGPPARMLWRGGTLDGLEDASISALADLADSAAPPNCTLTIAHYMHGELCRVPDAAAPMLRQRGNVLFNVYTTWKGDTPPSDGTRWVRESAAAIRRVIRRRSTSTTSANPVKTPSAMRTVRITRGCYRLSAAMTRTICSTGTATSSSNQRCLEGRDRRPDAENSSPRVIAPAARGRGGIRMRERTKLRRAGLPSLRRDCPGHCERHDCLASPSMRLDRGIAYLARFGMQSAAAHAIGLLCSGSLAPILRHDCMLPSFS